MMHPGVFTALLQVSDYNGQTALHIACIHNRAEVIDCLLQLLPPDENLERQNIYGNTPLKELLLRHPGSHTLAGRLVNHHPSQCIYPPLANGHH